MIRYNRNKTIILISIFTALTVVGANIKIPLPHVPITLQTFVVIMSGNLLGSRFGALSQIIYLTIGLIGIPIFAYGGGPGYVFQPTFGYLLGFPVCAFMIGVMIKLLLPNRNTVQYSKRRFFVSILISDIIGVLVIFVFGLGYIYISLKYSLYLNLEQASSYANMNWSNVAKTAFMVFVPIDIIKVFLASFLTLKIRKFGVFSSGFY